MSLSPLRYRDNQAMLKLGVLLHPEVHTETAPTAQPRPLPALIPFPPVSDDLRFQVHLALDYPALESHLTAALQTQRFTIQEKRFGIESVRVRGKEQEISVDLVLNGDASGKAEIWSNLVFDTETQRFRLDELNFVFEPDNDDLYLMANLFHERIRLSLQNVANQWLDDAGNRLNRRLQEILGAAALPGTRLDTQGLTFNQVSATFDENGVSLHGTARGAIDISGDRS